MSDCLPCTPVNPCYNCGCQESCNCPAPPLYTNESCPNGVVGSNCITLKNDTETCVGINTNTTTLTSFIDKIITYVKNVRNRFISTDGSLSITPINDLCNDKANIKVNIDPNLNNAIVLNPNGLYVAPVSTSSAVLQNLADVTTIGNVTPNSMIINGNFTEMTVKYDVKSIALKVQQVRSRARTFLEYKNDTAFTKLSSHNIDLGKIVELYLPNTVDQTDYTLAVSVNGIGADNTGNITIPISGGGGGTVYIGTDPIVVTGNIISVNEATQLQGGILNASATIQDIGGPKRFDNYIIVDSTIKIWKGPNLNSRTNLGIGDPTILGSLTAGANGNTALGTYIMYAATTSSFNTGVGSGSLYRLTTGNSNNFVGASSGEFITTGNYNVGVGEQILSSAIIGNNNTAIGSFSGSNLDVSGCVFIGYKAGRGPGLDNELHIGNSTGTSDLIYGKFDTNLFRVNGTLEVTSLKTTGIAPTPIGVTKLVTTDENGQQSFIDIPISGGGGTAYTASNGLTEIGTNIQLGGTLTENTNINAPGFGLSLIGTNSTSPLLSIDHTTLNDGYALQIKSAGAVGVGVLTVNGTAGLFENQALPLISRSLSASTAFYRPLLRLYNTPVGVAENGLGGNIDVYLKDSLNTENRAGVMGFDITDVNNATFTSRFRLQTKGNGILNEVLQIDGLGKVKLNKYGLGTFTGIAAYNLAIDASGNIIEAAAGGGGGTTYTASNGLTEIGTNIKLGGTLVENTNINSDIHSLIISGSFGGTLFNTINNATQGTAIRGDINGEAGIGVFGNSSFNGTGVKGTGTYGVMGVSVTGWGTMGESTSGVGIFGSSETGDPGFFSKLPLTTNTVERVLRLERTVQGTPQNGIGASIDLLVRDLSFAVNSSNKIITKLIDVTSGSRTSELSFTGYSAGVENTLLQILGTGATKLTKYGLGTFTGTAAYNLATDASGNIIEVAAAGGGGTIYTASNGLTEVGTNIKLGGTLIEDTTITTNTQSISVNGNGPQQLFNVYNAGSGSSIVTGSTNSIGLAASSINSTAIKGISTNGSPINLSGAIGSMMQVTTSSANGINTLLTGLSITRQTQLWGTAPGLGVALDFNIDSVNQSVNSNRLISIWLNDVARTSEFSITGINNAVTNTLLQISGTGATKLTKYGLGTFTGIAAYNLATDASGNIIEVATSGGGAAVTLTTTGTSGVSTLISSALNVPDYTDYFIVTKAQLDTAITNSTLVKGATYKVTGVHSTLYNDGTNSGTSIYIRAIETNKIANVGIGEFYNPKYNTGVNDFNIWNNISYMTASVPATGVFRPGEVITANNGATGTLVSGFSFNKIFFTVTSGDWTTATSATNAGGVLTNLSVPVIRTYANGSTVIWGGYKWTNTTGLVGASTSIFALGADWTKVTYNITDYNIVYDNIEYDYVNNIITKRSDLLANVIEYEFADLAYLASKSVVGTPINCFQWGNKFSQRNKVYTGCIENINAMGEYMGNEVTGQSLITNNFMFSATVIVEQNTTFIYNSIVRNKSEIRNNVMVEGCFMYRNTLQSTSSMNSNKLYNSAVIAESFLDVSCAISSNEIRRAQWIGNQLRQTCSINSNLANQNTSHILSNKLYRNSTISSNLLNGVYVQITGSDRCYIFNNDLNSSNINSNTFNVIGNGRTIYIGNNILLGDPNNDIPIRVSQINGCTITGNGNTYIRMCQLRASQINNAVIDSPSNDFRFIDLEDYVWNFGSVVAAGGKLDGVKANSKSITASFTRVFGGGVGIGAIGNVVIPGLEAPIGYFIEEVIIDVQSALVGTGAVLNLGIAIDNTQSGISNTTGDIATLNTGGITKIVQSTFTKATATRAILMEVKTAAITSGTIGITLRISKL